MVLLAFAAGTSHATAFRTFVDVGGNDGNAAGNCPRTVPCLTLAAAYAVTIPGGEIIMLSNAEYGGLTITKSVTITSLDGVKGMIQVAPSSNGITVQAAQSDVVVLENLSFGSPQGTQFTTGVHVASGRVFIRNSEFKNLYRGVNAAGGRIDVIDSNFINNTTAARADGIGANTQAQPYDYGSTSVKIRGGNFNSNFNALVSANPGYIPCPQGQTCNCLNFNPCANQSARTNIWQHLVGNSSADYDTNYATNTNFMTGEGASCTAQPNTNNPNPVAGQLCLSPGVYSGGGNPQ
jgi:hypothetical protein